MIDLWRLVVKVVVVKCIGGDGVVVRPMVLQCWWDWVALMVVISMMSYFVVIFDGVIMRIGGNGMTLMMMKMDNEAKQSVFYV